MAIESYKACSVCRIDKPRTDFSPDRRNKDGLQSRCKGCGNAANKASREANLQEANRKSREYYQRNRERILAANNRSRAKCAEQVKACKKAWYERVKHDPKFQAKLKARQEANKEAKREYDREYLKKNREKASRQAAEWRKRNPEKRAAIIRNNRDRRRAQSLGGVSTSALAAWTAQQKKACYWCGCKCAKGFHIDHYVPLSRGGKHELSNLVIACGPCNLRKNAKDPLVFAREVGRLL